jgi:hypothetical protein
VNGRTADGSGWNVLMVNDTDVVTASFHAVAVCSG